MKTFFRLLTVLLLLALLAPNSQAQAPAAADTARIVLSPALLAPVSLQDYAAFRAAVQPLIRQMAGKKVVALGEGTHGTAEFYKLRFWLTRILMEEHGFTQVALENDYTDTYQLGEALAQPTANLPALMRAHLYGIWQNQETAELLAWLQAYNRTHRRPLRLRGIDAVYVLPEAQALAALAARYPRAGLQPLVAPLVQAATLQDSVADNRNVKGYKLPRKRWFGNGLQGYYAADKLQQALRTAPLPQAQRQLAEAYVKDAKHTFDVFYQVKVNKRESSRDSAMAEMTAFLARGKHEKVIVWAHNWHIARQVANASDNNGGGTGHFLERLLPGQYYALATSTATGTYAATPDQFITRSSVLSAHVLKAPQAGSWEASLAAVAAPAFFLQTAQLGSQNLSRPFRFVGYSPGDTYVAVRPTEAYDAILFVRQTTAATPLRQAHQ